MAGYWGGAYTKLFILKLKIPLVIKYNYSRLWSVSPSTSRSLKMFPSKIIFLKIQFTVIEAPELVVVGALGNSNKLAAALLLFPLWLLIGLTGEREWFCILSLCICLKLLIKSFTAWDEDSELLEELFPPPNNVEVNGEEDRGI